LMPLAASAKGRTCTMQGKLATSARALSLYATQ